MAISSAKEVCCKPVMSDLQVRGMPSCVTFVAGEDHKSGTLTAVLFPFIDALKLVKRL